MSSRKKLKQPRKKSIKSAFFTVLGIGAAGGSVHADVLTFDYTDTIQTWLVPTTGIYDIEAFGAQGGTENGSIAGGKGAEIGGSFILTAGTQISIVVGGQGSGGLTDYGASGGGASWVYSGSTPTYYIIAAGGGGSYGSSGGAGQGTALAGTGAAGASSDRNGGGGAGIDGSASGTYGGKGFSSFAGGTSVWAGATNGGFGGGGAGGGYGGGGGGGYSGGNSGIPATGGTSFDSGVSFADLAGFQSGNGEVEITFESVPEPTGTAAGFLAAVLGAGALVARRRMTCSI